jgi:4-hydroxybenzoate polyprenyltransferase
MASMIPDVRDRAGDASAGVRTIPVIYGDERTRIFLTGVVLVLGLPAAVYSFLCLPLFTTMVIIAANLYSLGCVYLLDRIHLRNFIADALGDGQYIYFAAVIILITTLHPLFLVL